MNELKIKNLNVLVQDKHILKDFSLTIPKGQIHAIMGPNGTGKSTLAKVLVGHPEYKISSGEIILDGENIVGMEVDEIAKIGLFMAFQYPNSIPGVTLANFIRAALKSRLNEKENFVVVDFYKKLYEKMDLLGIDRSFTSRAINDGFSGGEKKRCEILQLMMLSPKYSILDETDSGLDIDALQVVAKGVKSMSNNNNGFLIITHYQRLLSYIIPDVVHIMFDGRIVHSGDKNLAIELEKNGYNWVKEEFANIK